MRILLLLICFNLGLVAKEAPRTMATRHVMSAKAFKEKRDKAMESVPKKKKQRTPRTRDRKAQWGAVHVRAK